MRNTIRSARVLLLTAMLAGCGDSGTGPDTNSQQATEFATGVFAAGSGLNMTAPPIGPQTVPCPAGGTRRIAGNTDASETNGERTLVWSISLTHNDCGMQLGNISLVLSGSSQSDGRSRMRMPSTAGGAPVILEYRARERGSMTTTQDGRSMTCSFDITSQLDPVSNVIRMTGTSCGRSVDLSRPVR